MTKNELLAVLDAEDPNFPEADYEDTLDWRLGQLEATVRLLVEGEPHG